MAFVDLGKLKFQWKGLWATSTAYEVDDVVHYDGSTYVVVTAVPATNTTNPGSSNLFELMARGLKFRGAYVASNTYLHNEVVTFQGASWISIQSSPFTGQTPATGSAYWEVITPAPATSVLTQSGDIPYLDNELNTARLPIGGKNTTLTVVDKPRHDIPRAATYSTNGTGTSAKAVLTDDDNSSNVFGSASAQAAITVTRGVAYDITFPANGLSYSIKDPAASNFSTAGSNGRVTDGVTPDFVNNGGVIQFQPNGNTPNTVVIRDEANGADVATVTVVDMRKEPSWTDETLVSYKADKTAGGLQRNTYTSGLQALPLHLVGYGRGRLMNSGGQYRVGDYLTKSGALMSWGNFYDNGTQGRYYDSHGAGSINAAVYEPHQGTINMPGFYQDAISGVATEAKWLNDLAGNSLGYTQWNQLKVIQYDKGAYHTYILLENGIMMMSGYTGYGQRSAGDTSNHQQTFVNVPFYNSSGTLLEGAARPRIKWFQSSDFDDAYSYSYNKSFAIDEDGKLYGWGYNAYGNLADGTTTSNYFAREIPLSKFGNEKIICMSSATGQYSHHVAITESGKAWGWGYNAYAQLGNGNTSNQQNPVEITGVQGSALNGKTVTHVMCIDGSQSTGVTYFLTTEGKVYASGYSESYGAYVGVYNATATTNITTPLELTNASTTINANGGKAIMFARSNSRYGTLYVQTDGGTTNQPKIFAWGGNTYGNQGSGANNSSGASTTAQGNWFGNEIKFMTRGNPFDQATATGSQSNPTYAERLKDQVVGTQYSTAITSRMKIGKIVMIWAQSLTNSSYTATMMMDEYGSLFACGNVADGTTYFASFDVDHPYDIFGTQNLSYYFMQVHGQPEQAKDWKWMHQNNSGNAGIMIGKSGTAYMIGSSSSWNMLGFKNTQTAWQPIMGTKN